MSYLGCDTPSYYTTTTLPRFWDDAHADAIVTAGGYSSSNAWSSSSTSGHLTRYHRVVGTSVFAVGHRLYVLDYPGSEKKLIEILSPDGTVQCSCSMTTAGLIKIYRGTTAGTLLATSAEAVPLDTHLDFGFEGDVDIAGGWASVWVGISGESASFTEWVSASGNTQNDTTTGTWRGFSIGLHEDLLHSHLYWRRLELTPGLLVETEFPDATGIYTGWTPNTGTTHAALDDADADDDTTVVNSNAVAGAASFTVSMSAATATPNVFGLDLVGTVRNGAATPDLGFQFVVVANASTEPVSAVSDFYEPSDSEWLGLRHPFGVNPVTGLPWTVTQINAAEFGGQSET